MGLMIVSGARRYPMSMARMFDSAFRRLGHTVYTIGPYSGDGGFIPWPGNHHFPQYVDRPNLVLPEVLNSYPLSALEKMGGFPKPDFVISFDAGFRLMGKLEGVPSILFGTDPHAIDYRPYLGDYDHFFSAQLHLQGLPLNVGTWIPLAYDPEVHWSDSLIDAESRPIDVCFVGVMGDGDNSQNAYRERWRGVQLLSQHFKTFATTGLIFHECTREYARAKIAYNMSSRDDIPMRCFEALAYGNCLLTNRLPHLEDAGFRDGQNCVVYDSEQDLVEKVEWLLSSGEWIPIAEQGHYDAKQLDMTYDHRCRQILRVLGFMD